MAEKNKSANLCESVEEETILNVTQDHMVTTNEIVSENVEIDVNETVVAGGSRDNGVNIFNQLALMMEMMSGMRTEMKSENNKLNTSLNDKFDQQNTSLNEFKSKIKSEINVVNIKLNKQDERLIEIITNALFWSECNKNYNYSTNW